MFPFHRIPPRHLTLVAYVLLAVTIALAIAGAETGDDLYLSISAVVWAVVLLAYVLPASQHAINDRLFIGNAVLALIVTLLLVPAIWTGGALATAATAAENLMNDVVTEFNEGVSELEGEGAVDDTSDSSAESEDACYGRYANEPDFGMDELSECLEPFYGIN